MAGSDASSVYDIADPMTLPLVDQVPTNAATQPVVVPFLKQDPVNPPIGSLWFDVAHAAGDADEAI